MTDSSTMTKDDNETPQEAQAADLDELLNRHFKGRVRS